VGDTGVKFRDDDLWNKAFLQFFETCCLKSFDTLRDWLGGGG
jgi:hypothetical protein